MSLSANKTTKKNNKNDAILQTETTSIIHATVHNARIDKYMNFELRGDYLLGILWTGAQTELFSLICF